MIKSFRHKGLKRLFETGERGGVKPDLANRLRRQLDVLNRARTTSDMNFAGLSLAPIEGQPNWNLERYSEWQLASDIQI